MGFGIPGSCTLPTAERPVRQAEFEAVFAAAQDARRLGGRHLRVVFAGGEAMAATVRDLAARESTCCSFFDFTVSTTDSDGVVLDVRVPEAHAEVLEAMTALATASPR